MEGWKGFWVFDTLRIMSVEGVWTASGGSTFQSFTVCEKKLSMVSEAGRLSVDLAVSSCGSFGLMFKLRALDYCQWPGVPLAINLRDWASSICRAFCQHL